MSVLFIFCSHHCFQDRRVGKIAWAWGSTSCSSRYSPCHHVLQCSILMSIAHQLFAWPFKNATPSRACSRSEHATCAPPEQLWHEILLFCPAPQFHKNCWMLIKPVYISLGLVSAKAQTETRQRRSRGRRRSVPVRRPASCFTAREDRLQSAGCTQQRRPSQRRAATARTCHFHRLVGSVVILHVCIGEYRAADQQLAGDGGQQRDTDQRALDAAHQSVLGRHHIDVDWNQDEHLQGGAQGRGEQLRRHDGHTRRLHRRRRSAPRRHQQQRLRLRW